MFRGRCRSTAVHCAQLGVRACTGCFGTLFWFKQGCCKEQALEMLGNAIRSWPFSNSNRTLDLFWSAGCITCVSCLTISYKNNILGKDLEEFLRVIQRAEAWSEADGPWWIWYRARPGHLQAARYISPVTPEATRRRCRVGRKYSERKAAVLVQRLDFTDTRLQEGRCICIRPLWAATWCRTWLLKEDSQWVWYVLLQLGISPKWFVHLHVKSPFFPQKALCTLPMTPAAQQ